MSGVQLRISLFNATGLPKQSIYPMVNLAQNSSLLFITETWLLPPNKYSLPTWKQFHTYGAPVNSYNLHRGQFGIALLVNPDFKLPIHHITHSNPLLAKFTLSIIINSKLLIHCLYLPPSLGSDQVSEILALLPMDYPSTTKTIICGDLNSRIGELVGDGRFNTRGRIFHNWMQSHDLILWNQRLAFGQPTFCAYQGTSIIDYFLSNTELDSPSLFIRDDLSLRSNHKFMSFTFHLPQLYSFQGLSNEIARSQWNLRKLKKTKYRDEYQEVFAHNLPPDVDLNNTPSFTDADAAYTYIEQFSDILCQRIYGSLDQVCGKRDPTAADHLKQFWTDEMTSTFNLKQFYYNKWRKANGLNCLTYWLKHQETSALLQRLIKQRRRETWKHFCDKMAKGDYSKAIARFSRIRKNRSVKPSFSPDPNINRAPADAMADHLKDIFAGQLLPSSSMGPTLHSRTGPPYDLDSCPFSSDQIHETLKRLPRKKAPGIDHLQTEMLLPLATSLAPQLLHLFRVCWQWSFTPLSWRVAQVVPIHKKGSKTDPGNFRPISLTSIFRKLFEKCLYPNLLEESPPLDIAQGGFRESRSSLDQVECLVEICTILRRNRDCFPTLAFLDIKSAYDTVDRSYVWNALEPYLSPALLGVLQNLFDQVHIEVLLDNRTSYRFSPTTGVLQGSILSPFLYSIYINQLPALLRLPNQIGDSPSRDVVNQLVPSLNCLLYADDVVLIASPETIPALLTKCETHSYSLGYRWNPLKCVVVAPADDNTSYKLYGTDIPKEHVFPYLGIPIKAGGYIDYPSLVQNNINKASLTMNQLASIGVNAKGFSPLLSSRFYCQMVRSQLDYGLAVSPLSAALIKQLDTFQNSCIRRIFGGHSRSSAKVMLHLVKIPSMKARIAALQAQYVFRSTCLPDDTLLANLLPYIQNSSVQSHWYKLSLTNLWHSYCKPQISSGLDKKTFFAIRDTFFVDQLQSLRSASDSLLLSSCRTSLGIDPILWLPMTCSERSRVLRWRLGWLPGGKPKECIFHPQHNWSRRHAFECLHIHHRLFLPSSIEDPISFLLNLLPLHKPRPTDSHSWYILWPILCTILHELDYYFHGECPPPPIDPGVKLLKWLSK